MPCSDGTIQSINLDPMYPWRFSSPNFPSTKGYPHNIACTWKFNVNTEKVAKISVICDHINIAGDYFNDCVKGDFLSIRHEVEIVKTLNSKDISVVKSYCRFCLQSLNFDIVY